MNVIAQAEPIVFIPDAMLPVPRLLHAAPALPVPAFGYGQLRPAAGQIVTVSAHRTDDAPPCSPCPDSGAVYVFAVAGDCAADNTIDACQIFDDPSLDVNNNGVLDACEPPIPTVSEWGLVAMTVLTLTAGTLVYARRHPVRA